MKRLKARLEGSGSYEDPFRVNLPTYVLDGEPDIGRRWAWVQVPDDEVDDEGQISQKRIREKYREGWRKFDASTVKPIDLGEFGVMPQPSLTERVKRFLRSVGK